MLILPGQRWNWATFQLLPTTQAENPAALLPLPPPLPPLPLPLHRWQLHFFHGGHRPTPTVRRARMPAAPERALFCERVRPTKHEQKTQNQNKFTHHKRTRTWTHAHKSVRVFDIYLLFVPYANKGRRTLKSRDTGEGGGGMPYTTCVTEGFSCILTPARP